MSSTGAKAQHFKHAIRGPEGPLFHAAQVPDFHGTERPHLHGSQATCFYGSY